MTKRRAVRASEIEDIKRARQYAKHITRSLMKGNNVDLALAMLLARLANAVERVRKPGAGTPTVVEQDTYVVMGAIEFDDYRWPVKVFLDHAEALEFVKRCGDEVRTAAKTWMEDRKGLPA